MQGTGKWSGTITPSGIRIPFGFSFASSPNVVITPGYVTDINALIFEPRIVSVTSTGFTVKLARLDSHSFATDNQQCSLNWAAFHE